MQLVQDTISPVKDSLSSDSLNLQTVAYRDSLLPVFADTVQAKGETFINLFQGHELKPHSDTGQPVNYERGDWLFILIIFVVAIFAYLRIAYRKYLDRLVNALFNLNITNQIVRDENILVQRASVMLSVIFYLVTALLVYFISLHYDWRLGGLGTGFIRFLFITVLIAAVYFLKLVVLKVAGWLFNQKREMSTYIFNIFLINNLLGLALIPIVTLFIFFGFMQLNWLLITAVALFACAYIYRLVRGILIGLNASSVSPVYLLLYLCALEIAPLLVLLKLISQQ
jgi:hypothetical protein